MASLLERMRHPFGGGRSEEAEASPKSPKSPKETWRHLDKGYNPDMHKVGRSYYDTVDDPKTSPGIWDYHLQAEQAAARDLKEAAFKGMGAQSARDVLDAEALRKMFSADRVDDIMRMADTNKDGKIDFKEFCDMIRKYPCD